MVDPVRDEGTGAQAATTTPNPIPTTTEQPTTKMQVHVIIFLIMNSLRI